jgi:hypothetical protein
MMLVQLQLAEFQQLLKKEQTLRQSFSTPLNMLSTFGSPRFTHTQKMRLKLQKIHRCSSEPVENFSRQRFPSSILLIYGDQLSI